MNDLRNFIKKIIKEEIEKKHQKYLKLKSGEPTLVYRGVHESGKNFYQGEKPLPFTYFSLTKEKAKKYGNINEYIFSGKVFFGSLFEKFNKLVSIEDLNVINQLKKEGYQAALVKGDELVVFDKKSIKKI